MKEGLVKIAGENVRGLQFLPGVESDESLIQRTTTFLREVAVANANKTILVVTHGSLLRNFLVRIGFATTEELLSGSLENTAFIKLITDGVEFIVKETQGVNKVTQDN